jgi:hypothetical protein
MDKGGVAFGLATISVVGAALLFSAEHVRYGPMDFIERIWALRLMAATVQWKFWSLWRL